MRALTPPSLLLAAALLAGCRSAKTTPAAQAGESASCVTCHGEAGSAAPPRTTTGETATTSLGVGAHAAHLAPGRFRKALACEECHPVPRVASDRRHEDGVVDVVFGPTAGAAGAAPAWNRAAATCSGTYCHGGTMKGGTRTAPVWTHVVGDPDDPASEVSCGGCHGVPPDPGSGHPAVDATIPGFTARPDPAVPSTLAVCATCHPDTVRPDGRIDVEGGRHIDVVVQTGAYACARCHGDPDDATRPVALRAAPPRGVHGETRTADRAVGAHAIHLQGTDLTAVPVACGECHAVPTSMRNHPNPAYSDANRVVDLSWGPLATAGGAVPAWSPATLTCSSTYCHGSTLTGGTATAPVWNRVDGAQRTCTSCHGAPPATPAHAQDPQANPTPTDCNRCHAGYSSTTVVRDTHIDGLVNVGGPDDPAAATCTGCHGDARRPPAFLRPAPPVAVNGATDPRVPGVGAHEAHLTGNHLSAVPVACRECHPAVTRTDHAARDAYGLRLEWGPLASAGLSHPEYDPQRHTCSNTYCHGSTLGGGRVTAPIWNEVSGDPSSPASQVSCGSCHGLPPPAPHPASTDCGTCHTGYTTATVNLALHVDGKIDVSGDSCTTCHGDPSRRPDSLAAAPPAEARVPGGGAAPWAGDGAAGAHLKHLVAGPLGPAVACDECHAVPASAPQGGADTHGDARATLSFGRLARTAGAAPAFDAATVTCSGTYCHGSTLAGGTRTAPVWTRTDGTQVACGACHAVPPTDAAHRAVATGVSCGDCHRGYGGAKGGAPGTFTVNVALHVNGMVEATEGTCTSCHGTAGRRLVAGADPRAASAPPVDATGLDGAGAHLAHLNKESGARSRPVACSECHAVPTGAPRGGADAHGDGRATVVFGPLARADLANPSFGTASQTCSSTYCHGATLGGGTNKTPGWHAGPQAAACGTCHGLPPPAPHPASASCGACHPGYTATTVDLDTHVDGKVDSSGTSCTSCHGDASRSPSAIAPAPPAEAKPPSGGTAPWAGDGASGAHLKHLVAGKLAPAIACSECHTAPTGAPKGGGDSHGDGRATLVFGALARSRGATPSFDAATATCSGTYCHGATLSAGTAKAPVWTRTDGTQVTCGACHGAPPSDPTHAALASGTACGGCHSGYGGTKGGAASALSVNRTLHLNGAVDATGGTCTSCHGTEGRTIVTGADARTASAPPADAAGFSVPGAHLAHLNKGTGALGAHVACDECHAVPASAPKGGADSHGDGKATVRFGARSRTRGASPSFNPSTLTCASTYCHGGGQPRWNDSGPLSCTACHAMPPNDVCHSFRHEASGGRCNGCHRNVNATGNGISSAAKHVDGVVQGQCSECHGRNMTCTNREDD